MAKDKPNVKKIIHLMFAQTKEFIFFCCTSLLLVCFEIATLLLLKGFVDEVVILNNYSRVSYYVVPLLFTFILAFGLFILHERNKSDIVSKVSKELSKNVYNSILNAEINIFENNDYSRSVKKAMRNSEFIGNEYIGKNVLTFIEYVAFLVGSVIMSLIVQPIFGLVTLIILPFYGTATKALSLFVTKMNNNYSNALENNNKEIINTFENIKNIKLLNGLQYQKDEFDELNKNYSKALNQRNSLKILNSIALTCLFIGVIYAIIIGIGGIVNQDINITAGTYILFSLLVPTLVFLVHKLVHLKLGSSFIEVQLRDLEKLIDLRSELKSESITNFDELHTIKFKDVVITEQKVDIINKISFELKKGEKLGIYCTDQKVKNLIFDLMTRLHKPDEGSISINNCDLTKISPEYLRSIIASVHQDSNVFSDTIIKNICYPLDFDEYKFNDALYRSGLKNEISSLENKEYTKISSLDHNDFNRRVVYANAIYKDAKIYLINESSMNLNVALETLMINEIYKLKNKTVIIETDKPYLLNKCDKILIVEEGAPIEFGRTDELLKLKTSRFNKLIKGVGSRKSKVS